MSCSSPTVVSTDTVGASGHEHPSSIAESKERMKPLGAEALAGAPHSRPKDGALETAIENGDAVAELDGKTVLLWPVMRTTADRDRHAFLRGEELGSVWRLDTVQEADEPVHYCCGTSNRASRERA